MSKSRLAVVVAAVVLSGWFAIVNGPARADNGIDAPKGVAATASAPSSQPASRAASAPASRTAAVTEEEARKIAEATLAQRKVDVTKMQYNGTHAVDGPDGRKFWHVAYGPNQPPPGPAGAPVARISGGQIIVKIAVDTGEVSMLFGM